MTFLEIMQSYFRGERVEALFYIVPAGLVLFGLAATALASDRGGFGWGMAVPLIFFGLLLVSVGAGVAPPGSSPSWSAAIAKIRRRWSPRRSRVCRR